MALSRKRHILLLATSCVVLLTAGLAFTPPSYRYDPAAWLANLRASATLPAGPPGPLAAGGGSVIIRHLRLVDGTGAAARVNVNLRIEGGRITAVGEDVGGGLPELDGTGLTALPGLMDAHVHLSMAPAAVLREDSPEVSRALRAHHLRAYLASGVTTVLDCAVDDHVALDIQRHLAAGHPGPRYLSLGPPFSAPGGYVNDLFPPGFASVAEVAPHLDLLKRMGAVGVKLPLERGVMFDIWNVHPPAMVQAISDGAAQRGMPVYVHAMNEEMYNYGLSIRPHAFVHHPATASDVLVARLAAARPFIVSTVAIWDVQRFLTHPELLDEPHARLTIPEAERQSMLDDATLRKYSLGMIMENAPFVPGGLAEVAASASRTAVGARMTEASLRARLTQAQQALLRLHRAGVPIVAGSDSGNWPIFPYYFHGPTLWRELELLLEAGLTPPEVIAAATRVSAQMLGLSQELGTLEVGKRADLIVVGGDPLKDLPGALRSLRWTVHDGVAHTPQEWMELH